MTEIHLKIDVNELKEIYFGNRNHVYFFGPTTKVQSTVLVLALIAFPFLSWYALSLKDNWLFVGSGACFALVCYDFWRKAQPIIKWKKSVRLFLDKTAKVNEARVKYTDEYISYAQDNDEVKINWGLVNEAIISDKSIWLHGSSNLVFPKSAMSLPEYNELSKMVMNKVSRVIRSN